MSVCAGATVTESPVWTPIGSTFSIEQMITTLSLRSRITSSSNSPQPSTDSSTSTWLIGLAARPSETTPSSSVSVFPTPAALAAERERRADDRRQLDLAARERPLDLADRLDDRRPRHPQPGVLHRLAERLAVLGAVDRVVVGADQLDPEPLQVPSSCSALARLSAVWPPSVGSSASGRSRSRIRATFSGSSGST